MNQNRYYAGEFDNDGKMHGAFVLVIVLVLALLTHYAAFWAGGVLAIEADREMQRLAAPKVAPVVRADWTQFSCRELVNICRKRVEASR